jgi:hypothetical protein
MFSVGIKHKGFAKGKVIGRFLKFDPRPFYEVPHVSQLVALQVLQEDPFELENSPSLLWLKVERSFLMLFALHVGQETF